MSFTNQEILRYSRHLIMPEVGMEGQEKLSRARVLLIGAGGLGSPAALYLAAAGVGTLGIVDFDVVDLSNLQRQILHGTEKVGVPKVESARERIASVNPHVKVEVHKTQVSSQNVMELFGRYDVIVDGTDNFPTRYLTNDASVFLKKPLVYGSIFRFEGQATIFDATRGPCYRCLFPEPPPPGLVPSCAEGGVLGILPGAIGVIQATEAVKLIIGKGEPLIGRLLLYDALAMRFREVKIQKDPSCPVCGKNPTVTKLIDYEAFCGLRRGDEEAAAGASRWDIEPKVVAEQLRMRKSDGRSLVLLDVREPQEYEIVRIDGAKLIPLGMLTTRVNELDTADEIITYCHHGMRSREAAMILDRFGFKRVKSLRGGINLWAEQIDQSLPRY